MWKLLGLQVWLLAMQGLTNDRLFVKISIFYTIQNKYINKIKLKFSFELLVKRFNIKWKFLNYKKTFLAQKTKIFTKF